MKLLKGFRLCSTKKNSVIEPSKGTFSFIIYHMIHTLLEVVGGHWKLLGVIIRKIRRGFSWVT